MRQLGFPTILFAAALLATAPLNAFAQSSGPDEKKSERGEPKSDDSKKDGTGAEKATKPKKVDPDADLDRVVDLHDLEARLKKSLGQLKSEDPRVWKRAERRARKLFARSGSPSFDLLLKRGRDALVKKELDAAIDHLTDLTVLGPDFAEGWRWRALAHLAKENPGEAMADMIEAVTIEPRNFDALFQLATLFERFQRPKDAYEVYKKALEIHPNFKAANDALKRLKSKVEGDDA